MHRLASTVQSHFDRLGQDVASCIHEVRGLGQVVPSRDAAGARGPRRERSEQKILNFRLAISRSQPFSAASVWFSFNLLFLRSIPLSTGARCTNTKPPFSFPKQPAPPPRSFPLALPPSPTGYNIRFSNCCTKNSHLLHLFIHWFDSFHLSFESRFHSHCSLRPRCVLAL